ncbi:uncharacterized protein MYCFIDRAFT_169041 [Pseudocercospora fijiensis CIRAD86]|uniref:Uncharacterized protein n=1 Tax=Pseudocercospora fijiensis (strain CIRAD86) TaxID=383855 RepID=N1Q5M2_PSEFD|nr:uncharacterized protein MYCFIDRAFT_169041 [Pseudocercospora fijiensis CIRAD86]EME87179.1 hypothetical protein MYCFIDRAFT_169041 [Pseudocercospora fijiensis CIRAD86]
MQTIVAPTCGEEKAETKATKERAKWNAHTNRENRRQIELGESADWPAPEGLNVVKAGATPRRQMRRVLSNHLQKLECGG